MKMNLQRRDNLSTRERLQGSYPRGIFNPLGISDEFLFRKDFSTLKGIISLQGNFYLAAVIHSLRRMNRDIPLGKNS